MRYRVTIRKDGTDDTRVMEAASRFEIYTQVKSEGGLVTQVVEEHSWTPAALSHMNIVIGTGVSQDQLTSTTKNLAGMLKAGLSLSRALGVIEKQGGGKQLAKIAADLSESVRKGSSFAEALAKHPKVFPPLYQAMVKAGEESGGLSEALRVIGLQMERTNRLVKKVRGAMIYPAIILVAIAIVFVLMMTFVVPTLTSTFRELKVELPLATRIIASISDVMSNNTLALLAGLVALIAGGFFLVRSKAGGRIILNGALRLPVVGDLVKETFSARASRTLSSLLTAGVPLLRALEITGEVIGDNVFGTVIQDAQERVKKGEPLSAAFGEKKSPYPIFMSDMLSVGEETGNLAEMLRQVAEFYEEDVEERTKDLSAIIEPVIMLVVGAGVGLFAVAMISPIYSLSSAI